MTAAELVPPRFTIDIASTDEPTFAAVFALLIEEHAESGFAPLNPRKTAEVCFRTLQQGMSLVARDADGTIIGSMGLVRETFWYSDAEHLQDVWLYVTPAWRRRGVGTMLLKAARAIADASHDLLFVTIANPARRTKVLPMGVIAQKAGYVPVGYTFRRA